MSDIQSLSSVCSLIVDCPHSTPVWTDAGYVVLRNQNIKNGKLELSNPSFTDEIHFNGRNRRAKPTFGDIVITREAPMGDVCMIPEGLQCCLGQRQVLLRPNPEIVNPRFILYALQSEFVQHQISWNEGTGSTVSNLRIPVLEALNIPTPPIEEQRAIAHILGTLDDKIELNRKQNETLEAMARAIFKAWFVDFEPVRAKMEGRWQRGQSLPGLPADLYDLFPDRLVETEIGKVPAGWNVRALGQQLLLIGGGTPKTSVAEYWDGEIPWYSVVDTPRDGDVFVVSTEKAISMAALAESSARLVPKGTTIISARGTVGNLAIAGRDMTFNQSCYGLRGAYGAGDYFVYLVAQQLVEQLKVMAHGSVFSTITRQTFDAIQWVSPPLPTLQSFEKVVSSWFDGIYSNVKESRTLTHLRDTLLPKLISGELRVPDAERIVGAAA